MYYFQTFNLIHYNCLLKSHLLFELQIVILIPCFFLLLLQINLLFLFYRSIINLFFLFRYLYIILWTLLGWHGLSQMTDICFSCIRNYLRMILNLINTNHKHVFHWIPKWTNVFYLAYHLFILALFHLQLLLKETILFILSSLIHRHIPLYLVCSLC